MDIDEAEAMIREAARQADAGVQKDRARYADVGRITALEEALRALLKGEGLVETSSDMYCCDRCLVESRRRPFPHAAACPVQRAKAVLQEGEA